TPVVLCYLEGQTYEEAARRIGCPVGTVRVRLSRARARLHHRLTRRGFGPARLATVGLFGDAVPPLPPAVEAAGAAQPGWVEATVRAAQAVGSGRAAEAGVVSGSVLALSEGVMRSMTLTHWKTAVLGLLAAGVTAAGATVFSGDGPNGQEPRETIQL